MEQRNRGIDLLRMTAMWMVVILHILNKGGVLAAAAPLSAGQGTARLLETAAYCAVNCFALITGYVGVNVPYRISRFGPVAAGGVLHAGHHGGICMSDARQRQR